MSARAESPSVTGPESAMPIGPVNLPSAQELLTELMAALRNADGATVATTALLLGVLCETAGESAHTAVEMAVDDIAAALDGARNHDAGRTAMLYLLAHFTRRRDLILSSVDILDADPEDVARLERCLGVADLHDPESFGRLGRSWPSPLVWKLTPAERELDARWREGLNLDADSFQSYWDGETAAVLTFLGAKAAYARSVHDDNS